MKHQSKSESSHTGGPTSPMAPADPDSPFDNKKQTFTNTITEILILYACESHHENSKCDL